MQKKATSKFCVKKRLPGEHSTIVWYQNIFELSNYVVCK